VRNDKHHTHFVVWGPDHTNGGDEARLLLFDPCRELAQLFSIERPTGEPPNLVLQARTEPAKVESGYLRRSNRGALGRIRLLRVRRERKDEHRE
jgi:hypothetical protein